MGIIDKAGVDDMGNQQLFWTGISVRDGLFWNQMHNKYFALKTSIYMNSQGQKSI